MGECTRLIYDLIFHREKGNISGLFMSIDSKKALDSMSWEFLYQSLEFFGFDAKFMKWVYLFNDYMNAYILQSGFLSDQ